jgi:hypothetical protein
VHLQDALEERRSGAGDAALLIGRNTITSTDQTVVGITYTGTRLPVEVNEIALLGS